MDECKPLALGAALERDCPTGVDLLICNAGFAFAEGTLGADEAAESIAVNYTGTALVCGRGLHSFTFQLNESAFYGTGGAFRGCLRGIEDVLGSIRGY